VWNDRASLDLPVRVSERLRPGVVAIPFGWWMSHHDDGKAANSLTNDTLTEWGGGVAFSDTLVQLATVITAAASPVLSEGIGPNGPVSDDGTHPSARGWDG
ncbi:MAG: hypothetical protein M3337_04725, partial [Actinomycetota bacterium]|nr:hypothetical protein [Actinomycetota bacterium]